MSSENRCHIIGKGPTWKNFREHRTFNYNPECLGKPNVIKTKAGEGTTIGLNGACGLFYCDYVVVVDPVVQSREDLMPGTVFYGEMNEYEVIWNANPIALYARTSDWFMHPKYRPITEDIKITPKLFKTVLFPAITLAVVTLCKTEIILWGVDLHNFGEYARDLIRFTGELAAAAKEKYGANIYVGNRKSLLSINFPVWEPKI